MLSVIGVIFTVKIKRDWQISKFSYVINFFSWPGSARLRELSFFTRRGPNLFWVVSEGDFF